MPIAGHGLAHKSTLAQLRGNLLEICVSFLNGAQLPLTRVHASQCVRICDAHKQQVRSSRARKRGSIRRSTIANNRGRCCSNNCPNAAKSAREEGCGGWFVGMKKEPLKVIRYNSREI